MRTLSRPMFNWGGPVKQGIMHGIREPYKHGGPTGTGLVGDQRYPQTRGREHHVAVIPPILMGIGSAARAVAPWAARMGARYLPKIKRMFGTTTPGSVTKGTLYSGRGIKGKKALRALKKGDPRIGGPFQEVTMNPAKFNPNWLGRDPTVRLIGGAGKSIFNPTTAGWAGKAGRFVSSPTVIGGVAWYLWPDGTQRKTPPPSTGGVPGGGDKGMTYTKPGGGGTAEDAAAFAKSQRDARVQKYMDMMGYDRSKKTAIADALIDASKIVSDRGTLDRKNITAELINPAIQALSKRLDKPEQIREAVGLMATKAEIEKDLNKETKALDREYKQAQIDVAKQKLGTNFEDDMRVLISSRKEKVNKNQLEQFARLTADKYGETFTKVEGEGDMAGDGIYMVEDTIIRVTDGVPKRII